MRMCRLPIALIVPRPYIPPLLLLLLLADAADAADVADAAEG